MHTELRENWSETRDALLVGLNENQKAIVAPLLENQKNVMLNETAAAGAIQTSDIANFRKTLLPMVRRIIPGNYRNRTGWCSADDWPCWSGLHPALRLRRGHGTQCKQTPHSVVMILRLVKKLSVTLSQFVSSTQVLSVQAFRLVRQVLALLHRATLRLHSGRSGLGGFRR